MNRKQLFLNCAIATFALSTAIGGSAMVLEVLERTGNFIDKPQILSIARRYGLLTFCAGISVSGIALGIFIQIETAELREELETTELRELQKPRTIPAPCQGCRNFHGLKYNGIPLNCAIHPHGWQGDKCPDWQSFHYLNK